MRRLSSWIVNAAVVAGFGLLLAAAMVFARGIQGWYLLMVFGALLVFSGLAWHLA